MVSTVAGIWIVGKPGDWAESVTEPSALPRTVSRHRRDASDAPDKVHDDGITSAIATFEVATRTLWPAALADLSSDSTTSWMLPCLIASDDAGSNVRPAGASGAAAGVDEPPQAASSAAPMAMSAIRFIAVGCMWVSFRCRRSRQGRERALEGGELQGAAAYGAQYARRGVRRTVEYGGNCAAFPPVLRPHG